MTLGGKQHVPWITTHIKRVIRRRQRRYNATKKHNTNKNWKKYKEMRNLVRKTMNETHDNYARQILNHYEDSKNSSLSKNFWKYHQIQEERQYRNIATLKFIRRVHYWQQRQSWDSQHTIWQRLHWWKPRTDTTTWKLFSTIYRPTQYNRERSLHITEETRSYKGKQTRPDTNKDTKRSM
jgi:hypothetical protein